MKTRLLFFCVVMVLVRRMTALEFDRLVVEDVITIGYLALPSAVTSAGVKTHGEA